MLSASACGGPELPPIVQRSPRLTLRAPAELEICAGTFDLMESEVIELQDRFGVEPGPVEYTWMPESHYDDAELPCKLSTLACSLDAEVYARTLASTHELVHAARESLPAVLEEGLATFLSAPSSNDPAEMVARAQLLEALALGSWEGSEDGRGLYERSAHFVSFLISRSGWDKFIEFERRVRDASSNREQPLAEWTTDFEAVYGETFEQAWAAYADYPDCALAQFHHPLTACGRVMSGVVDASLRPAFMADAEDAEFSDALACTDDHVFGPHSLNGGVATRAANFVIEVDNWVGGSVAIALSGAPSPDSRALVTSCGDCWDGSASMLTHASPDERLAARGAMPRAASLGLFAEGFVAKTCSTPGTAAFWLRALGENSGARRHDALHHGLLELPSGLYALILYGAFDTDGALGLRLQY
ncbi:hypothetical protein [Enhygromyxa salina]|uniref:hypothetical protein n=1 Tax=Enhygromyxa salina TaxID=215803 RepID=UPI0011B1CED4|nr:hypothetical protein [Enhygromyxa salina]